MPRGVYILDEELPGCEVKWWEVRELLSVPCTIAELRTRVPSLSFKYQNSVYIQMVELSKLDLSRNSLKTLPEELFSLGSLTYMDVRCARLCGRVPHS